MSRTCVHTKVKYAFPNVRGPWSRQLSLEYADLRYILYRPFTVALRNLAGNPGSSDGGCTCVSHVKVIVENVDRGYEPGDGDLIVFSGFNPGLLGVDHFAVSGVDVVGDTVPEGDERIRLVNRVTQVLRSGASNFSRPVKGSRDYQRLPHLITGEDFVLVCVGVEDVTPVTRVGTSTRISGGDPFAEERRGNPVYEYSYAVVSAPRAGADVDLILRTILDPMDWADRGDREWFEQSKHYGSGGCYHDVDYGDERARERVRLHDLTRIANTGGIEDVIDADM